jgi:hypothetical protein
MNTIQNERFIQVKDTANGMVFRNGKWALADAIGI